MNHLELLKKIQEKFEVVESKEDLGVLNAVVRKKDIKEVAGYLKDSLGFGHLAFLTALDFPGSNIIEVVYNLYSYDIKSSAVIRVKLDRTNPEAGSISGIFKTADWHERETAEMFGVVFTGHPSPGKLLLDGDTKAPLRKDFQDDDYEPMPKF